MKDVVFTRCSRCFLIDTQAIRSKILDLAIQGLLTEHLSEEGTGEELIDRIIACKKGKHHGGKKQLPMPSTPPFDLPVGWAWAQLATLGADVPNAFADGPFGSNLKREHYTTERQVRIIQLSNVGVDGWRNNNEKYTTYKHLETIKRSEVNAGNIVIAKMMPAGRAIVVPEGIADAFVLSSDCIKFVPDPTLDVTYLCCAINSTWFHDQVMSDVHGIGRERTSLSNLKRYFVPIPPVPEQRRIVSIIQKAFSSLDTIDSLQAQYADNLTALKSKLIDAAIQGKLTEQLPEDGTAEDLYRQIQTGKIKKGKPLPLITEDDIPFDIPESWKWVRLGELGQLKNGFAFKSSEYTKDGIQVVRISDLAEDAIGSKDAVFYPFKDELASYIIVNGSFLICMTGSIGKMAWVKDGVLRYLNQRVGMFIPSAQCMPEYLWHFLHATYVINGWIWAKRSTNGNIRNSDITGLATPLPPLTEQKRIVARLEELLPLCEQCSWNEKSQ